MARTWYLTHRPALARWSAITLACAVATLARGADDIVFLAGDPSHGPGEHEFNAGCLLLANAINTQSGLPLTARVIRGWPADEVVLDHCKALVVYADGTKVVGKGWDRIDALCKRGAGLMLMHYAVHPKPEEAERYYRPWIGGAFETGWSVNPHWVAELTALPDHPVSRGVQGPVVAYDEFYYHMRFVPEQDRILRLATAIPTRERIKRYINLWNEHGVAGLGQPQPLLWGIQRPDGGRGVGFTGGHYHRNWANDGFRTLVLNAIVWTATGDVPEGGVKSLQISEEQLNANLDVKKKTGPRLTVPTADEVNALPAAEVPTEREAKFPPVGGKP